MGIDSLMAVELQTVVDRDLRVSLPLATLLEGVTVRQLSVRLLEQLALESVAPEAVAASHRPASPAAHDVDEMPIASRAEDLEATATVPLVSQAPVAAPPRVSARLAPVPTVTVSAPATGEVDYPTIDYNRWTPRQRLGQKVISGLFRVFAPIDVQGLENIPPSGPVLVAVNHLSMLDVALILTILPRRCICIATDSLRRYPWLRWFLDLGDSIYVRRGEADLDALAQGLAVLRAGGLLGVAPEGTRSRTGGLTRGQPGVAYLAAEAPAPILPVVAYGQEQVLRNLGRLRRTRVHVRVGSLITVSPGERTAARLQRDTERVMTALAAMLPPAYRGVYGDLEGEPQSPEADTSSAR
jgi:1-acyl-sn-glycerol-3-phosphate acyltransferase